MFKKIENYGFIVMFVIILLILVNFFQSCNKLKPGSIVVDKPVKVATPAKTDNQYVPTGSTPTGRFAVEVPKVRSWQKVKTTIIISAQCNTCTSQYTPIHEIKNIIGFSFEPRMFVGHVDNTFTFGYDESIFRYSRFTFDGLVGFPIVGVGIAVNLTNNFYILAGAGIRYVYYSDMSQLDTYYFDFSKISTIYPLGALGFAF